MFVFRAPCNQRSKYDNHLTEHTGHPIACQCGFESDWPAHFNPYSVYYHRCPFTNNADRSGLYRALLSQSNVTPIPSQLQCNAKSGYFGVLIIPKKAMQKVGLSKQIFQAHFVVKLNASKKFGATAGGQCGRYFTALEAAVAYDKALLRWGELGDGHYFSENIRNRKRNFLNSKDLPDPIGLEGVLLDSLLPQLTSCPQCATKVFPKNLSKHIESHSGIVQHCEKCAFSTDRATLFQFHVKTVHTVKQNQPPPTPYALRLKCTKCSFFAVEPNSQLKLDRHGLLHTGIFDSCQECPYSTDIVQNMAKHAFSHTQEESSNKNIAHGKASGNRRKRKIKAVVRMNMDNLGGVGGGLKYSSPHRQSSSPKHLMKKANKPKTAKTSHHKAADTAADAAAFRAAFHKAHKTSPKTSNKTSNKSFNSYNASPLPNDMKQRLNLAAQDVIHHRCTQREAVKIYGVLRGSLDYRLRLYNQDKPPRLQVGTKAQLHRATEDVMQRMCTPREATKKYNVTLTSLESSIQKVLERKKKGPGRKNAVMGATTGKRKRGRGRPKGSKNKKKKHDGRGRPKGSLNKNKKWQDRLYTVTGAAKATGVTRATGATGATGATTFQSNKRFGVRRSKKAQTDEMFVLPSAWKIELKKRAGGTSAGLQDTYYISPSGRRCRSLAEVKRYLNLPGYASRKVRGAKTRHASSDEESLGEESSGDESSSSGEEASSDEDSDSSSTHQSWRILSSSSSSFSHSILSHVDSSSSASSASSSSSSSSSFSSSSSSSSSSTSSSSEDDDEDEDDGNYNHTMLIELARLRCLASSLEDTSKHLGLKVQLLEQALVQAGIPMLTTATVADAVKPGQVGELLPVPPSAPSQHQEQEQKLQQEQQEQQQLPKVAPVAPVAAVAAAVAAVAAAVAAPVAAPTVTAPTVTAPTVTAPTGTAFRMKV